MRNVKRGGRFKTSFKRVSKNKLFRRDTFEYVVMSLAQDIPLASIFKDHELHGLYKGIRECHLAPNLLLMYQKEEGLLVLRLIDIGSHSELFS